MKKSVVYFLAHDGQIKIGFTTNFKTRVVEWRRKRPGLEVIGTIPGDRKKERSLHQLFAAECIEGEWFRDTIKLRSAVAEILAGPHEPPVDPDFGLIGRVLRATFGENAAEELHRSTGLNIRSCYGYVNGERRAPGKIVKILLRNGEYGEKFLHAMMDGCQQEWWLEAQRRLDARRSGTSAATQGQLALAERDWLCEPFNAATLASLSGEGAV